MSSFQRQQSFVKESLFAFLQKNCTDDASLSAIDDIVLSYVTSVLEDLGADSIDSFEVEQFVEMMGAYFPGFIGVDTSAVCDWLFTLATTLSQTKPRAESESSSSSSDDFQQNDETFIHWFLRPTENKDGSEASPPKSSDGDVPPEVVIDGDGGSSVDADDDPEEHIQLLQEMFPKVCVLEMTRCLAIADGCPERAAQLIIHRLDSQESFDSSTLLSVGRKFRNNTLNDKQLKESILSRYAFVDKAEDERDHKPITPKTEPKKLIRYRDNKVVSIKGEKFSEIKGDDDEEAVRKATSVSLKPVRQYRFH